MKPVLALDLDELLFPFVENFVQFVNVKNSTHFTVADFHTYSFEEVFETSLTEVLSWVDEFLHSLEVSAEPLLGAVEAIRELEERYTLFVVTARHDAHEQRTLAWLQNHFPDTFRRLVLCNLYPPGRTDSRTKVDICVEVDAIGLVDDSLHYVTEIAATGRKGILFGDYPWNQASELPEGVTRARDWDELRRVLAA